jgi:hypothetical protein
MVGLISDPEGNVALDAQGADAFPSGAWEGQDWLGTTKMLGRAMSRGWAEQGVVDDYGRLVVPPEPTIPADEATKRFGIDGHLKFSNPVPESVAQQLYNAKREELMRQDAAARGGGISRMAVGFLAGALDPMNIAASFMPVVGEARMAGALARFGVPGLEGAAEGGAAALGSFGARTALRAATGFAGGTAVQVPLSALRYGLSRQEQADYSVADAMADVFMGGLLGGGLHTLVGTAGDVIGQRFARTPQAQVIDDDPAVREAAMRAAVAAVAEGRPVRVGDVLPTATSYRPVSAEAAPGNYSTFTPAGTRIEARPEIVPLDSLVVSHRPDGTPNQDYPADLQGRDRASLASQDQINDIAAKFQPELMGPAPEAGSGAPIVGADDVVESGNGRSAALRQIYTNPDLAHRAAAYREWLMSRGYDLTGIDNPVLIGRRMTDLTPDQRVKFAAEANERPNLAMNAAEQGRADAQRVSRVIDLFGGGRLGGQQNKEFLRGFMAQLPKQESGGLMKGTSGELNLAGERRINGALLAHAYGDKLGPTLERMLEGETEHMRSAANALVDAAPAWGRMRAAAARGDIPANLDITDAVGEAVRLFDEARAAKRPIGELLAERESQGDMLGGLLPSTRPLLRLMFQDDGMTRPAGRERVAELLRSYAELADKEDPRPDMFGKLPAGPGDIFRRVMAGETGENVAAALDQAGRNPGRAIAEAVAGETHETDATRAQAEEAVQQTGGTPAPPVASAPRLSAEAPPPVLSEEAAGIAPADIVNPIDRAATPAEKLAQLQRLTEENKPVVADIMRRIDDALGTKSGSNVKAPENILSKASRPSILARKPWHDVEHIRDSFRFKTVETRLDQIGDALRIVRDAGVKLVKIDTAKLFDPGEWGWRIVSFDLRMPNGQLVEWYLPIKEMENAKKNGGHQIFEEWRNKTQAEIDANQQEFFAANTKSRELYRRAFMAALERMGYSTLAEAKASFESSIARALETSRKLSDRSTASGNSPGSALPGGRQAPEAVRNQPAAGPDNIIARPVSRSSSAQGPDISSSRIEDIGGTSAENINATVRRNNGAVAAPNAPTEQLAELEAHFAAARAAGALTEETEAALRQVDDATAESQSFGKAIVQAAACLIRGAA